jgi:transposase InsO family protein
VRFAFIRTYQAQYEVTIMCRVLQVSRGGSDAWVKRQAGPPAAREMANATLATAIQTTFTASRGTYGAPRVQVELTRSGRPCSRNRVARLMRQAGLWARPRRAYRVTTTNSQHAHPVAPNTLNRQFWAAGPDEKWVGDITYIRTREGWLFLAVLLDLYSRKVVGWAMDPQMEQALVARALTMATTRRRPRAGRLHHTDRGSQYAAHAYQQLLATHAMAGSMSRKGECYDNAVMESFFATLKAECATGVYATRAEARRCIFEYIEVWYNRQRRHSALDYVSPEAFEQARVQTTAVS